MCRETDPCDALGKLQMFTRALLDDIGVFEALELIYSEFASVIPFQRIGYAEVDTEFDRVTACWAKADGSIIFAQGLFGSSKRFFAKHRIGPEEAENIERPSSLSGTPAEFEVNQTDR